MKRKKWKEKRLRTRSKSMLLSLALIFSATSMWGAVDEKITIGGQEITVTVLDGYDDKDIDNPETVSKDFNSPFKLEKDKYYYFGPAPTGVYATRSVLWDRFENVTIKGETGTGVVLKFKGITGYYRIRKVNKLTNRENKDDAYFTNTTFLRVVPLRNDFAENNKDFGWEEKTNKDKTAKFQDRDVAFPNFSKDNDINSDWGYGCLYIAGGPGFGYGEYDAYWGWDARWTPEGYDKRYVLADNQMWIPSPEKNLYKFRLQAGGNISNDPQKAFNVKFYLNNYLKKQLDDKTGTNWDDYNLTNSWRGNRGQGVETYPYLMHLKDGRDCFTISGNIPGNDTDEQENSPDWNNGNFRTATIGFDSDMPAMPEGYTFEITLDLRNTTPADWERVDENDKNGVMVDIAQIKNEKDAMYKYLNPEYMTDNEDDIETLTYNGKGKVELYLGYYGYGETAENASKPGKRIKLRDALRLDYGIRYANQYNKEDKLEGIEKYNLMKIHGTLSSDDMQYLSWLCNNDLLTELDLSDAILPDGLIPEPMYIDGSKVLTYFGGESTKLEKVIVPANGIRGVGKHAFHGCANLENVAEIVDNVQGFIGESAFEGCTSDKFTSLTIPETVSEIGSRAFAGDKQLTKITVPEEYRGSKEPWDAILVGEQFFEHSIAGTIKAYQFNKTKGLGFNATGGNTSNATTKYRNDLTLNDINIWDVNDKDGNRRPIIGDTREGDFFNYTFNCNENGNYKITFNAGIYKGDNNSGIFPKVNIKAYIDGRETGGVTIDNESDNWDYCDQTAYLENVMIGAGKHVFKIVVDGHVNLESFVFEKTNGNYVEPDNDVIPACNNKDTFENIPANNCELVFTGDDNTNNYEEYRKQEGWMYLLTKDLREDNAYKNVNQLHADAKHTHKFESNAWYSIVLPFDVNAKTLAEVNNGQAFDKAARYKYNNFSGEKDGYKIPKAHFIYLDNEVLLNNASGEEIIRAGEPFLVHCLKSASDNVYLFEDVHTICSNTGEVADENAMTKDLEDNSGIRFIGNLYDTPKQLGNNAWFISNKYYHSTGAKLKPYRAWLEATTEAAAKGLSMLFGDNMDDDSGITGIATVNTEKESTNSGIYNLSGQKIRKGNTSVENLPKGVYIVNGKRIVIIK